MYFCLVPYYHSQSVSHLTRNCKRNTYGYHTLKLLTNLFLGLSWVPSSEQYREPWLSYRFLLSFYLSVHQISSSCNYKTFKLMATWALIVSTWILVFTVSVMGPEFPQKGDNLRETGQMIDKCFLGRLGWVVEVIRSAESTYVPGICTMLVNHIGFHPIHT